MPPQRPKVIFCDAVGTLFGVRESVGQHYLQVALPFGANACPKELDRAFFEAFKAAPPCVFPESPASQIPQKEYNWWKAIAWQTWQAIGQGDGFQNFEAYFGELFAYFATDAPWFVYPETRSTLSRWQAEGIELGIISNFDSRLYRVLDALNLKSFFQSITTSTAVGVAKPSSRIFEVALNEHGCLPQEALHVGDSLQDDYWGARRAGLQARWLDR